MKVRIGNDICLHVTLLGNKGTDYLNIKSMRAYLVNVSRQRDIDEEHRHDSVHYHDEIEDRKRVVRYISRFPAEPHHHAYHGTPYDLCHCGHPTFHVHPIHCVAPYIGFGVHPHSFDPFHNHLWGYDDMMDLHGRMLHNEEHYRKEYEECEFLAPVSAAGEPNKVNVYFPAESQLHTGTYKLVIVAKLYEPGYGKNDLRTVTMDYNEVFTIVGSSDEEGAYGSIKIEVGNLKNAIDIQVVGDTSVAIGQIATLTANVLPVDIDNDSVIWDIKEEDKPYLTILATTKNTCKISGVKVPQNASYYTATLRVTSAKTPSVYKDITITVFKDSVADIYTYQGSLGDNIINLNLTDGKTVGVDVSKETAWYEGD